MKRGLTVLEILTVVLIIGVLVALALPRYGIMRERTLDNEAKANLRLIQAAERIYRMEISIFYPTGSAANTAGINQNLRLFLPTGGTRSWNYSIADTGGSASFNAQAARFQSPANWNRHFKIDEDDDEACCCPDGGDTGQCLTQCASCP